MIKITATIILLILLSIVVIADDVTTNVETFSPTNVSHWNNITDNSSTVFYVNPNSTVEFGYVVNQTANFVWSGVDSFTGNGTSSSNATKHYSTNGTYTVAVFAENINGSTSTLQWNVDVGTAGPGSPNITSFTPLSLVSDNVGATREFGVIINQTVNCSWYIGGNLTQTNTSIVMANYTNTSAIEGTWNVSAICSNNNGADIQTWTWTVSTSGGDNGGNGGGGGGGGTPGKITPTPPILPPPVQQGFEYSPTLVLVSGIAIAVIGYWVYISRKAE